mmetsp:Transcript_22723/g.36887  ORF Transcript_22723/g.36887 Transcript_22723/m.36887 type:complete len:289 (-) Transcript_22723:175-1041(-)|eukprot:CAMPEP_0196142352 /NCGR_PEP_ID=MMETSP0910-20130528/11562_1 /TAXON_ID=49265 /ORGANISM="Thalassiosira rotula, Strain GSO102" /LENGTH=288 /DNA_ID=CAMNT_0041403655 /DNA_START=38 /DNA_END=904 /DNA_ORIENTATION=-
MTMTSSKLHSGEEVPVASVLPYKPNQNNDYDGPKAYAVGYKDEYQYTNQHDYAEAQPIATVMNEATVIENLGWDPQTRKIFIRKVYSILAVQLLWTGMVSAFMVLHVPTQTYVMSHAWPVTSSMVLSFILIFALMCYKDQAPANAILLAAFTTVEAFMVGTVVTVYCAAGMKGIVLEAVFLTGAIFIGLTLFTFQSKIDFSFMGAGLSMGLGALLLWGFFAMLFGMQTGYVYALLGCILFSGYILFDTWLIMDRLSPSEYVLAAISLYLDIINLFLMLLQLLADNNRN